MALDCDGSMVPERSSELAYRPEGFWSILSKRRAHLTLGGLVIADHKSTPRDEVGGLLPWRVLAPMQQGYIVLDDDGRRLHRGRRMLVPTCPTARGRRLAKRVQVRAVRRGLADASIDVTVCFPSMRWARRVMLSLLIASLSVFVVAVLPTVLRSFFGPQPGGQTPLAWITLAGVMLTLALFGGAYGTLMYRLTDSNVRRVRFKGGGLEASLKSGDLVRQRWADLRGITEGTGNWRLEFVDGTRLRVLSRNRAGMILREVRRAHVAGAEEALRRGHVRTVVRLFIWCQLGGVIGALLSARFGVGRPPLFSYLGLGFGMPVVLLILFGLGKLQSGEPLGRRPRRRAPAAASSGDSARQSGWASPVQSASSRNEAMAPEPPFR